jgi:hypothetical protein
MNAAEQKPAWMQKFTPLACLIEPNAVICG